jgi:hypothetical protein
VAGGVFQSTSEFKVDRSKAMRATIHAATVSGARVQQKAVELTSEVEGELTEAARKLRSVREHAKKWRRAVIEGGPARAAGLREVEHARRRANKVAREGWLVTRQLDDEGYADALAEIDRRAMGAQRSMRLIHPTQGAAAYRQWRLLARMQNWRVRAMIHGGRGDWRTRQARQQGSLASAKLPNRWIPDKRGS